MGKIENLKMCVGFSGLYGVIVAIRKKNIFKYLKPCGN